jgi:hypothetical protein
MANVGKSIYGGKPMSTGLGMDIAKQFGATQGMQGAPAGVGHEFSRDNQLTSGQEMPFAAQAQNQQVQQAVPSSPGTSQMDQLKKRQYALGLNGIPSPFGYTYGTAKWL